MMKRLDISHNQCKNKCLNIDAFDNRKYVSMPTSCQALVKRAIFCWPIFLRDVLIYQFWNLTLEKVDCLWTKTHFNINWFVQQKKYIRFRLANVAGFINRKNVRKKTKTFFTVILLTVQNLQLLYFCVCI